MKIVLFANTDWYLYNFRLPLARALRKAGAEVVLVSPPGVYAPGLRSEGLRWVPLMMERRSLNVLRELRVLRRLIRLYRIEKPDVVHHFTIKCVVYGSIAAALAGIARRINAVDGLGYVFTSNDWTARLLAPIVRALMRIALAGKLGRLIVQNDDDWNTFVRGHLVRRERMRLIRGAGVDTRRFRPALPSAARPVCFRVLFAGRLLWDKGVAEYVQAARRLNAAGMNAEFVVAGSADAGNPASVPPETIATWSAERQVTVLGHVDDMTRLLADVSLVVLPSYREGVPCSLIEAASCGLPIVTTDAPGCREVVEHGVNGLLVPCKDPAALAEAIRYLYEHPEERERMGRAGRAKVLAEFDEDIVIRRTLDVYRELVSEDFSAQAQSASEPKQQRSRPGSVHGVVDDAPWCSPRSHESEAALTPD